jgi:hypothetical protein
MNLVLYTISIEHVGLKNISRATGGQLFRFEFVDLLIRPNPLSLFKEMFT